MRRLNCSLVIFLFFVGCTPETKIKPLPLYPVDGTVKVDGKPMAGVSVTLYPTDAKSNAKPAIGVTDKDGSFKLRTNGDRGVAEGVFKVVVSEGQPDETPSGPRSAQADIQRAMKQQEEFMKKGSSKKKTTIPAEWANPQTTPKSFNVTKTPEPLEISI